MGKLFRLGDFLSSNKLASITGDPMKKVSKRKGKPKTRHPEQFQRFIEAARKRGMTESLENFAVRFGKSVPPQTRDLEK
jgi:hypothetical protein